MILPSVNSYASLMLTHNNVHTPAKEGRNLTILHIDVVRASNLLVTKSNSVAHILKYYIQQVEISYEGGYRDNPVIKKKGNKKMHTPRQKYPIPCPQQEWSGMLPYLPGEE